MRFSRHAKNGARAMGATLADAERIVEDPMEVGADAVGKPLFIGILKGRRVRVVVALDDPELIVTIHPRRKGR